MTAHRLFTGLLALALSGCAGSAAPAAPTPGPTSSPTPSAASAMTPSPLPESSATEILSPTPTVRPSATPRPATPTRPAPTATAEGQFGPVDFPLGINPLTGLPADPAALALPPLNIKVSNAPPCVRPQYGLSQADVVFEHYVEAWATRLTAVYHSQLPTRVGSVRSARQIDLELPAIFGAGFVFSGASAGNQRLIDASDFAERTVHALDACPVLCRVPPESVACHDSIHTLFANAQAAQTALTQGRAAGLLYPLEGWAFAEQPPRGGEPAARISLSYLNAGVRWQYRAEAGLYFRQQTGVAHTDAASGQTLSAANVVVLYAPHVYSDIQESPLWYSLQIQFWGTGAAVLFRDGRAYPAQWVRADRPGLFRLVDQNGHVIAFRPGQTWFEFVGARSTTTPTGGEWTIDPEELPLRTPPQK